MRHVKAAAAQGKAQISYYYLMTLKVNHGKHQPETKKTLKAKKAREAKSRIEKNRKEKIEEEKNRNQAKHLAFRNWEASEQNYFYEEDYPFIESLNNALRTKATAKAIESYQKVIIETNKRRSQLFHEICPYDLKGAKINVDQFKDKVAHAIKNIRVQKNTNQHSLTDLNTLGEYTQAMQHVISLEISQRLKNQNPELISLILAEVERIAEPFNEGVKPRLSKEFQEVFKQIGTANNPRSEQEIISTIIKKILSSLKLQKIPETVLDA